MWLLGRWFSAYAVVAVVGIMGCEHAQKPYADDPLLTSGRGVRGDQERARGLIKTVDPEPAAPSAPPPPDTGIATADNFPSPVTLP
jgi:hypothetical protein